MFIQCQHCQTTYKIDEHKIPDKKSVVRCAKCSELIPLNREKQDELLKKSPSKIVICSDCGTQYSVPLSTIKHESTKVKCGKCGNLFEVSRSGADESLSSSAEAYESDFTDDDISLDSIDIPSGSEIEVDELFENIELTGKQKGKKKSGKSKDTAEEYLESIKLTKDGDGDLAEEDLGINEIAKDQKYKIFLKPKSKKQKSTQANDLTDLDDLPFADEMDNEFGEETTGARKSGGKAKRTKKSAKQVSDKSTKKRRNVFLWLIWALVILALVALAWLVMDVKTSEVYTKPQTETFDNQSKIAILEPLNGRFIKNIQIPERMFVLEGKLLNIYGEEVVLSKIEIEGYLYTQNSDQPITAISFAGVTLDDDQLKKWNKLDIESELMSQSEDSNALLEYSSDDLIDFQVVFFNAPEPQNITKLGAKIKKFNRRKK